MNECVCVCGEHNLSSQRAPFQLHQRNFSLRICVLLSWCLHTMPTRASAGLRKFIVRLRKVADDPDRQKFVSHELARIQTVLDKPKTSSMRVSVIPRLWLWGGRGSEHCHEMLQKATFVFHTSHITPPRASRAIPSRPSHPQPSPAVPSKAENLLM